MTGRPTTNLSGVVCVKMSSLDKIVELGIHLKSQSQNKKKFEHFPSSRLLSILLDLQDPASRLTGAGPAML